MNQHWQIPSLALAFAVALCLSPPGRAAGATTACASLDPELVHCPPPEAPRVTGLGHAEVVLELEVAPDGSVVSTRVVSATGHPAWRGAVEAAVATWRYVPAGESRTRVIPFVLGFDAERRQAPEVGGCSDGPEVLDLDAKVYWTR